MGDRCTKKIKKGFTVMDSDVCLHSHVSQTQEEHNGVK